MDRVRVDVNPDEIVAWIRADSIRTGGYLTYYHRIWVDYDVEKDFDRRPLGLPEDADVRLVTSRAVLDVEPRVEQNYWILHVTVQRELGLRPGYEESSFAPGPVAVESFRDDFLHAPGARVSVLLLAETDRAREHFADWLATMRRRHAPGGEAA